MTGPRDRLHVLSVLHAAERTGPPLLALQFLRWLRDAEPDWRFSSVFLDAGGPLEGSFAELGPTTVAGPLAPHGPGRRRARTMAVDLGHRRLRSRLERMGRPDVAHVHCAGSFKVVPALPPCPVLGHLHELSVGQEFHLGPLARRHVATAQRYVAVSDGVATEFVDRFGVDAGLVERQWGFVDPRRLDGLGGRDDLGLGADEVVVVSAGVRNWRKAPELFVRIAQVAALAAPHLRWRFIWVGGDDTGGLGDLVARAGLDGLVQFLPHQAEALRWIAAADVFLLPAREDAFPLVAVEAAAAGRPIVTFDNGGAAELVGVAGCGVVSPFHDLEGVARSLVELALDPERRTALGCSGAAFAAANLSLEHAGPRLRDALARTAAAGRRSGGRR